MSILKQKYEKEVKQKMIKQFNYKNVMMVPKIVKVVLNMGVNEATQDKKVINEALEELTAIAGQRAVKTKAKKSINQFKLRQGQEIGCKVTLRRDRMWEFLNKFFNIALPRVKDFKGVSVSGFDGKGNFNIGIREHVVFPEIEFEKVEKIKGLSISIVTTAKTDEECKYLLQSLGMPFKK
ncbi:MAG: 50S ribosomal protein L5 [Spirochaetes bacterium]|nr:50S ribosomal protein L5 [Spirochaetota bacterium]